eukprot:TRINITY_DN28185_c0_g1_i1.p1 TRINITY_DN28185_c0_g1~~TRINITY_DN28185_c0_g1_i1.p1  ORF type:complete len:221 (+),score=61.63 TRINITY_DN28185_c0_g1_i1:140-802(+)
MVQSRHNNRAKLGQCASAGTLHADLERVNSEMNYLASLEAVKHQIYKHRLTLQDFFGRLDRDNSGNLDLQEFVAGLKAIGVNDEHAQTIFNSADNSHDGLLQFNEFIAEFKEVRTHRRAAAARGTSYAIADELLEKIVAANQNVEATFLRMDKDGNGWISKKELKDGLTSIGLVDELGCGTQDFNALWRSLDTNHDGRVNWCEWLGSLKKAQHRLNTNLG